MEKYLELNNGMKLLVISEIEDSEKRYFFSVSTTENLKYLFLESIDENHVELVEDGKIIAELYKLVLNKTQNLIQQN